MSKKIKLEGKPTYKGGVIGFEGELKDKDLGESKIKYSVQVRFLRGLINEMLVWAGDNPDDRAEKSQAPKLSEKLKKLNITITLDD